MDAWEDELSAHLSCLVDVGVVQAQLELEVEFPDRAVGPLRDDAGREVEAEDWRQGDAFEAGGGARQALSPGSGASSTTVPSPLLPKVGPKVAVSAGFLSLTRGLSPDRLTIDRGRPRRT